MLAAERWQRTYRQSCFRVGHRSPRCLHQDLRMILNGRGSRSRQALSGLPCFSGATVAAPSLQGVAWTRLDDLRRRRPKQFAKAAQAADLIHARALRCQGGGRLLPGSTERIGPHNHPLDEPVHSVAHRAGGNRCGRAPCSWQQGIDPAGPPRRLLGHQNRPRLRISRLNRLADLPGHSVMRRADR